MLTLITSLHPPPHARGSCPAPHERVSARSSSASCRTTNAKRSRSREHEEALLASAHRHQRSGESPVVFGGLSTSSLHQTQLGSFGSRTSRRICCPFASAAASTAYGRLVGRGCSTGCTHLVDAALRPARTASRWSRSASAVGCASCSALSASTSVSTVRRLMLVGGGGGG